MKDIVEPVSATLFEGSPLVISDIQKISQTNGHHFISTDIQKCDVSDIISEEKDKDKKSEESKSGFKLFRTLSRKQNCLLILLTLASFLAGVSFSILGPFYPTEAANKGMNITTVGLVFGIFELAIFVTAPFFGTYLVKIGPRFVFLSGIFVAGTCKVLFGTLEYCPSGTPFITMSLLIRSVEAVGFSGYTTSSFAIVGSEFKQSVALAYGVLETGTGLGFTLGPTIGGGLFHLGGFGAPFYLAGVAVLLNGMAAYQFLPPVEVITAKRKGSMITLLRKPIVTIPLCSIVVGVISIKTIDATLAEHLALLELSVGMVGIIFGILSLVYSIMSFIWGYVSDYKDMQSPLIVMGHLVLGIGYLLLGPSALLPFIPFNLVTVVISMVCIGVSLGCCLIPTMKCMVVGAIEMGFEDNVDTYALVSGLFTSTLTLGGFIGPVGVANLIQRFDYPVAYTVVAMCNILMVFVSSIYFSLRNLRRRSLYKV